MLSKLNLNSPIACFVPLVAVVPIIKNVSTDLHPGGLSTLYNFFSAALFPSLNEVVLKNAISGMQTTICIAFVGWIISIINGLFLGIICSNTFIKTFENPKIIQKILKGLLAIPRGIHELIWGFFLLQIYGLTPWVAVLAISIPYSSLMARVISDQVDSLNLKAIHAMKISGIDSLKVFITVLYPKLIPIIITFGGYRLECALRGATLLGVFGLGGIGTELLLSIQSLQFREVWTSLWILGIVVFSLEKLINQFQKRVAQVRSSRSYSISFIFAITLSSIISISCLNSIDIYSSIKTIPLILPPITEFIAAITSLSLIKLIYETIVMTILAAGLAIGVPPLMAILFPSKMGSNVISIIWLILRIIPAPLIALLLLLSINPSVSVAALALGLNNMGVMGKILKENIERADHSTYAAIKKIGCNESIAWLYGKLSFQTASYLAYSFYRVDVILRETAVIGIVGGIGLGWQLQESLSSFAWAEVLVVVTSFVLLTVIGELISEKLKSNLIKHSLSANISYQ